MHKLCTITKLRTTEVFTQVQMYYKDMTTSDKEVSSKYQLTIYTGLVYIGTLTTPYGICGFNLLRVI